MNRKQRAEILAWALAKKRFGLCGIEIESLRVDIGKNRTRASPYNCAGRGKKAEWRGENLISRLHAGGSQSQPESVGAGGTTSAMFRAAERCQLALERFDFRAENVLLGSANALDGRHDFGTDLLILAVQVEQRDGID